MTVFLFVPKFQAPENLFLFIVNLHPSHKYPYKGSKTCCHGLLNFGFLITIVLFLLIDPRGQVFCNECLIY